MRVVHSAMTLKESIWYLGETSFACFQAHNIGLSKNVTISPKLGSAELSYGLSWVIVTKQACGQQDQSKDICNMEMKSTQGVLADPSECSDTRRSFGVLHPCPC